MGNKDEKNAIREWIETIKYKKRMTQQDIAKELNLTLATVNKCIQYLKDIRVIYPIGHCDIIINHNYIFRGNMLQFYEDYKRLYPDQKGEIF